MIAAFMQHFNVPDDVRHTYTHTHTHMHTHTHTHTHTHPHTWFQTFSSTATYPTTLSHTIHTHQHTLSATYCRYETRIQYTHTHTNTHTHTHTHTHTCIHMYTHTSIYARTHTDNQRCVGCKNIHTRSWCRIYRTFCTPYHFIDHLWNSTRIVAKISECRKIWISHVTHEWSLDIWIIHSYIYIKIYV